MKTLVSAVVAALMSLFGAGVAHAGGPGYLLYVPVKYWILLIVILVILNLLCCWWRRR